MISKKEPEVHFNAIKQSASTVTFLFLVIWKEFQQVHQYCLTHDDLWEEYTNEWFSAQSTWWWILHNYILTKVRSSSCSHLAWLQSRASHLPIKGLYSEAFPETMVRKGALRWVSNSETSFSFEITWTTSSGSKDELQLHTLLCSLPVILRTKEYKRGSTFYLNLVLLAGEVLTLLLMLCSHSYPFYLLTFLRTTFLSAPHQFLISA